MAHQDDSQLKQVNLGLSAERVRAFHVLALYFFCSFVFFLLASSYLPLLLDMDIPKWPTKKGYRHKKQSSHITATTRRFLCDSESWKVWSSGASAGSLHGGASFKVEKAHFRGPQTHTKSRDTKKNAAFTRTFSKVRVNFAFFPVTRVRSPTAIVQKNLFR